MRKLPTQIPTCPPLPTTGPRQLSIRFEPIQLWGMSAADRAKALALLAVVLMQAAGATMQESDDDER